MLTENNMYFYFSLQVENKDIASYVCNLLTYNIALFPYLSLDLASYILPFWSLTLPQKSN